MKVGIKSSALFFGDRGTKPVLALLAVGTVGGLVAAAMSAHQPLGAIMILGGTGSHLLWQLAAVNLDSQQSCLHMFKSNNRFALLVAFALIFGNWVILQTEEEQLIEENAQQ